MRVLRNERDDLFVPQNKVATDAVGFFSKWEITFHSGTNFKGIG